MSRELLKLSSLTINQQIATAIEGYYRGRIRVGAPGSRVGDRNQNFKIEFPSYQGLGIAAWLDYFLETSHTATDTYTAPLIQMKRLCRMQMPPCSGIKDTLPHSSVRDTTPYRADRDEVGIAPALGDASYAFPVVVYCQAQELHG